jgi:hypothetical protein
MFDRLGGRHNRMPYDRKVRHRILRTIIYLQRIVKLYGTMVRQRSGMVCISLDSRCHRRVRWLMQARSRNGLQLFSEIRLLIQNTVKQGVCRVAILRRLTREPVQLSQLSAQNSGIGGGVFQRVSTRVS